MCCASCNNKKKKLPGYDADGNKVLTYKEIDSLNERVGFILANKEHAVTDWKNNLEYTYQLQNILDSGDRVIAFTGNITDIIRKDSNFILKVTSEGHLNKNCFADIYISQSAFRELEKNLFSKTYEETGCFIIKNTKLKKLRTLTIDSEVQGDDQIYEDNEDYVSRDALFSQITYSLEGKIFIFRGELVDFYLYRTADWYRRTE